MLETALFSIQSRDFRRHQNYRQLFDTDTSIGIRLSVW
jgi:hypothetical protein